MSKILQMKKDLVSGGTGEKRYENDPLDLCVSLKDMKQPKELRNRLGLNYVRKST